MRSTAPEKTAGGRERGHRWKIRIFVAHKLLTTPADEVLSQAVEQQLFSQRFEADNLSDESELDVGQPPIVSGCGCGIVVTSPGHGNHSNGFGMGRLDVRRRRAPLFLTAAAGADLYPAPSCACRSRAR